MTDAVHVYGISYYNKVLYEFYYADNSIHPPRGLYYNAFYH